MFSEHHLTLGNGFLSSPFEEAVVLCMDGVGEWATTSAWIGKGNNWNLCEISFPHSLGLLYSAFTIIVDLKLILGNTN